MRTRALALAAFSALGTALPFPAGAQQWPDRAVRIVVPFPPGGGIDIQGRVLANAFQKSMGQNFIVDNRTGASGLIGTQLVVESPADGNTNTPACEYSSCKAMPLWYPVRTTFGLRAARSASSSQ